MLLLASFCPVKLQRKSFSFFEKLQCKTIFKIIRGSNIEHTVILPLGVSGFSWALLSAFTLLVLVHILF